MARVFRVALLIVAALAQFAVAQDLQFDKGDRIAYIGNTMADRMQHHAWLETYIHALFPEHNLTFRNLGFSGDEIKNRPRSADFGDPDQWLTKVGADVVFCFFGYNEALRGEAGLAGFQTDLASMIDQMRAQKYNGKSAPKIVVFSPIAHENLNSRHLPDGSDNNQKLDLYTDAMRKVCESKDVRFVDLFAPTLLMYRNAEKPLTMNGVHLLDHGNQAVAKVAVKDLFKAEPPSDDQVAMLRDAVLEKNYYWFSRYRVVDGYNVYGGRSRLAWHGQSNADVMRREMEIFDVMTANRDEVVWAASQGRKVKPGNKGIPELLDVKTNKPGPLPGGKWPYLGGEEAIGKMKIAEGMQVNLFASEEQFPRLVNPVQVAVDTDSRLWASVWPSYPHWNPTQPRRDALLIFPDDNEDGKADECIVFADELNSITAFEFWGGGVLVASPPEIWFLKDTDGDDKADVKIRMLQGVSSADTHHSANAMVVGPDGWLYWSRGIFNIANFETPTHTFRSGASGVHRFNPRTFEFEFHFPIGPNPHGDVIDQWGYQFANDGTSGTGSYVNIGKGIGNKQWFKKRVRPVPATGILDSSHFPEENKGNFLICNAIGFLGVLQHEVKYSGAEITAHEVEPIVMSSDANFRPSDVEIGGDGALYIADWHNTLIGHMQHNMRDPNRDHEHGRIYRVTAKGGDVIKPAKMKGKPISEVVENFFARETATRYRARLELTGRDETDIQREVGSFSASLNPKVATADRDEAQALLECLWVFEEQRLANMELLRKVFAADEARVRAAAIRTLGHWAGNVDGWEGLLLTAAKDESALVRAEAVKAAVEFEGLVPAEAIFLAATLPTDPEMDTVLKYATGKINVDALVQDAVRTGKKLSPAAQTYMLRNASPKDLLQLERSDAVYAAILSRPSIPKRYRWEAISSLAKNGERSETQELIARVIEAEKLRQSSVGDLASMLSDLNASQLTSVEDSIAKLAADTRSSAVRTAAYTAWIRIGGAQPAWDHASAKPHTLEDLISSLGEVDDPKARATLYGLIRPLMFQLPEHLGGNDDTGAIAKAGPPISFEYYFPNPKDVSIATLEKLTPKMTGQLASFQKYVPKGARDGFATRQTSYIDIPQTGSYKFSTVSDDGSRLYIDKKEVVNNDGLHGMAERSGSLTLDAGLHEIVVTYYDNGGGDGLQVLWEGPGIKRQEIPNEALSAAGPGSLRDSAIQAIARWPGHFSDKVSDFTKLIVSDSRPATALKALASLPANRVAGRIAPNDAGAILKHLFELAGNATPVQKQASQFSDLLELGDQLVTKVSINRKEAGEQLASLRASIPERVDPSIMALGKSIYTRHDHCATCHQPHGQGMPNLYPPLDGSLWATGSEDRLIRIVLDGMHGAIEVRGKTYSSPPLPPMTAFRQLLTDDELAAVLTYVRNRWTNRAKPIDPAKVAAVRAATQDRTTFWQAGDLLAKYPMEDGRVSVATKPGAWVPQFVKAWKYDEIELGNLEQARKYETGQLYFNRLGCARCHKLADQSGGIFGPDLTKLDGKKHTPEHILQSILEPSKEVDKKYAVSNFLLDSGKRVTGLVSGETPDEFHVVTDPLKPDMPTIVKKDEVERQSQSESSIMPAGMLNWLTNEEILDLIAFVYAKGEKSHELFKP